MGLFGRKKSLLGLDIGSASVKAVELTRVGQQLVITGMGKAEVEGPEAAGEAISKALREGGIKSKRTVSAVSGRSVIHRQVPMMTIPDAELKQAMEYEADKYIPFDVSEVQLDAQRLKENEGDPAAAAAAAAPAGQMKVLLVAAKKNLIQEHINLLESVGLKPAIIDVDFLALGNAFELRNLSLGINDAEVRALVDVGASKTDINIMRGNSSFFQREIFMGGNDLTDAVAKRFGEDPKDVEKMKKDPGGALESMQDAMLPVLEDIGSEIRLSFDYHENQYDQEVKEVYVSGGSVLFPGIDTMLAQIFNLPVKIWDPTEGLEITSFNPGGMGGANSDMAIALGLASRLRNL
ncbi:MAG TPA: type IV pilus assembly protein PilM [Planctomycetota bacterium]|jgi:type IV pilus assembly protein PilM